jgi:hypothetical protein
MKFINANTLHRESGVWGTHRSIHMGKSQTRLVRASKRQFLPSSHVVAFSMRVFCTGLVKILSPWPIFM